MGKTPFISKEMKDLQSKVNMGNYTVEINERPTLQCVMFLN